MEYVTSENFEQVIAESPAVVVDFFATWCQPCKMLGKLLEEIAPQHPEVKIVKVDIDQSQDLAQRFAVMSVPTVLFFKHGELQDNKMVGFKGKPAVEAALKELVG